MISNAKLLGSLRVFAAITLIFGGLTVMNLERLEAAPGSASSMQAVQTEVVNVNTADVEELQMVRGIGPSLAERIVAFRSGNGPFEHIEDLKQVRGIGTAKLEKLKDQITV